MIPAYNKKRCAVVPFETGIHFRRKTDFFPEEDTTMSYWGNPLVNVNPDTQPSPCEFPANFGCLRNCSCNHASLPHPTHQSGDSLLLSPINIRPQSTTSIWDGGTLRFPFRSDVRSK
ncbi:hypothetical protein TNCV_4862721 [Trichonephila clavipes]|nr:hypothetical protein TNCV_4862721 [Trichonephila clavipes]